MQGEHLVTMLHTDRPCSQVPVTSLQAIACQVTQRGGIPYVVSQQDLSLPLLFLSLRAQRGIYAWADVRGVCASLMLRAIEGKRSARGGREGNLASLAQQRHRQAHGMFPIMGSTRLYSRDY